MLNADKQPLTTGDIIAVRAEESATNTDEDRNGDAVSYPDDTAIPLVASESGVVGFGAPIAQNSTDFKQGNEEFVLNVLDAEVGSGTVLFDEGHGQFYDSGKFSAFTSYAGENGYEVTATSDIASDLKGASGVIITSPSDAFSDSELDALASFADNGGGVLLFGQSDFRNFDATANMNAIAESLGVGFRFNDDQVLDTANNAGAEFTPVTDQFNTAFPYFEDRSGLGLELDPSETYTVDVVDVADGDTVDVQFDNGAADTVRIIGIDTPETSAGPERVQEWEGIDSIDALVSKGEAAAKYAEEKLGGKTVELSFDENEPLRGNFGRLLGYITVDDTLYNRQAIEDGQARLYDSAFARHDSFLKADIKARLHQRGIWSDANLYETPTRRNNPVAELFFPKATSVTSMGEHLDPKRVPVAAEGSAQQTGDPTVTYDADIPLVGIDQHAGVAMVGAPIIDETYEAEEDFGTDTSGYGNFPFLTNLIDRVSDREIGPVLIDGGHGQFAGSNSLSAEDAAYYLDYLAGVDISFEGVNTITDGYGAFLLSTARAIIITTPIESFSDGELHALKLYRDSGGAVILMGAAAASDARANLNAVSDALCSDLQLNTGQVVDSESALAGDQSIPVTSNFDTWFRLFDSYSHYNHYKGARGGPGRPGCRGGDGGNGNGNGNGNSEGTAFGNSTGNGTGRST